MSDNNTGVAGEDPANVQSTLNQKASDWLTEGNRKAADFVGYARRVKATYELVYEAVSNALPNMKKGRVKKLARGILALPDAPKDAKTGFRHWIVSPRKRLISGRRSRSSPQNPRRKRRRARARISARKRSKDARSKRKPQSTRWL